MNISGEKSHNHVVRLLTINLKRTCQTVRSFYSTLLVNSLSHSPHGYSSSSSLIPPRQNGYNQERATSSSRHQCLSLPTPILTHSALTPVTMGDVALPPFQHSPLSCVLDPEPSFFSVMPFLASSGRPVTGSFPLLFKNLYFHLTWETFPSKIMNRQFIGGYK